MMMLRVGLIGLPSCLNPFYGCNRLNCWNCGGINVYAASVLGGSKFENGAVTGAFGYFLIN